MVSGNLDQLKTYISSEIFSRIEPFLSEVSPCASEGRIIIDGNRIFAGIDSYCTKSPETALFESHKRFVDIQFLLDGSERIDVRPVSDMMVREEYDSERDIMFYEPASADCQSIFLEPGIFAVFFPQDGHCPGLRISSDPVRVKKVVIKISTEFFDL